MLSLQESGGSPWDAEDRSRHADSDEDQSSSGWPVGAEGWFASIDADISISSVWGCIPAEMRTSSTQGEISTSRVPQEREEGEGLKGSASGDDQNPAKQRRCSSFEPSLSQHQAAPTEQEGVRRRSSSFSPKLDHTSPPLDFRDDGFGLDATDPRLAGWALQQPKRCSSRDSNLPRGNPYVGSFHYSLSEHRAEEAASKAAGKAIKHSLTRHSFDSDSLARMYARRTNSKEHLLSPFQLPASGAAAAHEAASAAAPREASLQALRTYDGSSEDKKVVEEGAYCDEQRTASRWAAGFSPELHAAESASAVPPLALEPESSHRDECASELGGASREQKPSDGRGKQRKEEASREPKPSDGTEIERIQAEKSILGEVTRLVRVTRSGWTQMRTYGYLS